MADAGNIEVPESFSPIPIAAIKFWKFWSKWFKNGVFWGKK